MRRTILAAALITTAMPGAFAQNVGSMSLSQFLEQVRTKNPEARSAVQSIASFEYRDREAEVGLVPELYAQYGRMDDKKPTAQPMFMGTETKAESWRAGLRKQFEYGLGADLYFNAQRSNVVNASPQFMPVPDVMESSAVLNLQQSLWRNGFGESTRAKIDADKAETDANLLQSKFKLKNILLNAENAYWSVVTYNEVVKLQQENVERAKKLRDYMTKRTKMKLYDETDALQAQAAFETRELELQKSLDERAALIRQLNTLRGMDSDQIETLESLPSKAMMAEAQQGAKGGQMTREDFALLRAQARAGEAKAKYAKSQIQPQLDISAQIATNGRDGTTGDSYYQAGTDHYPTWKIGLNFSIPLDFGMIRDLSRGYRKAHDAAEATNEQAAFSEARMWQDLNHQKGEAKGRFERSQSVEKIQTELVKRERTRLLNGRTTTFEALNFEQNLALAQIQRVKAQLDLLQIHNAIKTFEAKR